MYSPTFIRIEGGMPCNDHKPVFHIAPVLTPAGSIDEQATFRRAVAKFMGTGYDAIVRLNIAAPGMEISGKWWWKGGYWDKNQFDD